jgi:hypothetical protein
MDKTLAEARSGSVAAAGLVSAAGRMKQLSCQRIDCVHLYSIRLGGQFQLGSSAIVGA